MACFLLSPVSTGHALSDIGGAEMLKTIGTMSCLLWLTVMVAACEPAPSQAGFDMCQGKSPQESFTAPDGCNTCTCSAEGVLSCTEIACGAGTCTHGGQAYEAGDSFPSEDGCNSCVCGADGSIACTTMACVGICEVGGQIYLEGDSWAAADGCNSCSCSGGQAVCSALPCATGCSYNGAFYPLGDW